MFTGTTAKFGKAKKSGGGCFLTLTICTEGQGGVRANESEDMGLEEKEPHR